MKKNSQTVSQIDQFCAEEKSQNVCEIDRFCEEKNSQNVREIDRFWKVFNFLSIFVKKKNNSYK